MKTYIKNMFSFCAKNDNAIFLGFWQISRKEKGISKYNNCVKQKMLEGEKPPLIVSDIFHLQKYDTNEVDREQKTLTKIN